MNTNSVKFYCYQKTSLILGIILCFFIQILNARADEVVLASESLNIVTVAGRDNVIGDVGDDGPATAALLVVPGFVTFDSSGNYYITEGLGHRIRAVNPNGIITTFVGTGVAGYGFCSNPPNSPCAFDAQCGAGNTCIGDNIPRTEARLNTPRSTAFDSLGNFYIADVNNHRIRVIDPAGIITTFAGNGIACNPPTDPTCGDNIPATAARLFGPAGIAFDYSWNLYFTEVNGQRLRKIDTGGTVTTVAGNGTACVPSTDPCGDGGPATGARFNAPNGIAFDASGNLYIGDVITHRVRFINLTNAPVTAFGQMVVPGNIATIAGTGVAGYGVRCSHDTTVSCTADSECSALQSGSTCSIGDNIPVAEAKLNAPRSVNVDSFGNLYISDFANHRVRRVDGVTGIITTIAGIGVAGFSGDGGPPEVARLNGPNSVTFDSSGNIYIAEAALGANFGRRIRRLNVATPVVDVRPDEMNAAQLTLMLQFPDTRDARDVEPNSVKVQAIDPTNGTVRHISNPVQVLQTLAKERAVGNMNQLKVKVDRATVASWADGATDVFLRVVGQMQDGRYFSGDTQISTEQ